VGSLPPDVRKILEEQGIIPPEQEAPEDRGTQLLKELGLAPEPTETSIFQPIRTAFGATQGVGGKALGVLAPEAYAAAEAELRKNLGVTEQSPWYKQVEASPGLGDVGAQLVPESVRQSRLGTALGPVGRLAGNIAGDPTTYTPWALGKLSSGIVAGIPEAAAVAERAAQAEATRRAFIGPLTKTMEVAQNVDRANDARAVVEAVRANASPLTRRVFTAGNVIQSAEPYALGTAAALAYGPEALKSAYEGWKQVAQGITEQPVLDTAAEAANATLLTALTAMMGHGLISTGEAMIRLRRHLAEQQPAVERAINEVGGRIEQAVEAATPKPPENLTQTRDWLAEGEAMLRQREADQGLAARRLAEADRVVPPERPKPPVPEEPPVLPEDAVSLVAEPIVERGQLPAEVETFLKEPGNQNSVMLQKRFKVGRTQAERWLDTFQKNAPILPESAVTAVEGEPLVPATLAPRERPRPRAPREPVLPESAVSLVAEPIVEEPVRAPEAPPSTLPAAERPGGLTPEKTAPEVTEPQASTEPVLEAKPPGQEPTPQQAEPTPAPTGPEAPPEPAAAAPVVEEPPRPAPEAPAAATEPPKPEDRENAVQYLLKQGDDELAREPAVARVLRSIFGLGSRKRETETDMRMQAAASEVLETPEKRAKLLARVQAIIEKAQKVGEEVDPKAIQNEVAGFIRREAREKQPGRRVEDRAQLQEQAAVEAAEGKRPEGKMETPKARSPHHYDYLNEQLRAPGSPLQKAGLKSVSELVEALRPQLEAGKFPAGWVQSFADYVAARDKGATHADAVKAAMDAQNARGGKWSSPQAAANALNRIGSRAGELLREQWGGEKPVQVEGRRAPTPQELDELGRDRLDIISHIENAVRTGNKEELSAGLGAWLAHVERRKVFDLKRDYTFMRPLKTIADQLNALGDGPKIPASAYKNATQLAEAIARNRGIVIKELKPRVEEKLAPARAAEVARLRAPAQGKRTRGPGGFEPIQPRGDVKHIRYKGPGDTYISFIENEGIAGVEKFNPDDLAGVREALSRLREDSDVRIIDAGEVPNKALDVLLNPEDGKLPAFIEDPDAPEGVDRLIRIGAEQNRIAEMAARDAYGIPTSWETRLRAADPDTWADAWGDEAREHLDDARGPMLQIKVQLEKLGIKGTDLNQPVKLIGYGRYHNVYEIPGAKDADGHGLVLRVGALPDMPLPKPEQRALVIPTIEKGVLFINSASGEPIHYTVHPKVEALGAELGKYPLSQIDKEGRASAMLEAVTPGSQKEPFHPGAEAEAEAYAVLYDWLPQGVTLQEFLSDAATLLGKAASSGLDVANDVVSYEPHGELIGGIRAQQFAYMPVKALDTQGVGRVINGKAHQLVAIDKGLLTPWGAEAKADPLWGQMQEGNRIAASRTLPDSRLTLEENARKHLHYDEDARDAVEIDEGLVSANHDRMASQGFVDRHGELGVGAARALRDVVDDLTRTINATLGEGDAPLAVGFKGLTSSPFLRGLYHEVPGEERAHIYANVVEAVNGSHGNYERAVDDLVYAMVHEVAHNKSKGHGSSFQTWEEYVRHHIEASKKIDQYREMVKKGFTKEDYHAIADELVPEFQRLRRANGNQRRASWREAAPVEGVPAGGVEGRAPPLANRPGRATEGAALDLAGGVEPGGAVPGGGEGAPGGVRPATVAGEPPASGFAEAKAARPAAGGDPLQEIKQRIAEYGSSPTSEEKAKNLLSAMMEAHQRSGGGAPTHDAVFNWAYQLAGDLVKVMHPNDLEARARSLPYPRKPDQMHGVVNMLHNVDLPVETKARIQITGELTKGLWPADHPQRWDQVEKEMHDVLGLYTPEQWAQHYRNQKGGPTAKDVLIMRQVADELYRNVTRAEEQLYHELATNKNLTPERLEELQQAVNKATGSVVEGMLMLTGGQAKAGRALAIHRKDIRALDPQIAFQQDLRAALRERTQSRWKNDPKKAEQVANDLYARFMAERTSQNPDWGAFQEAYRAAMGSHVWPDKILEWYKGGLLGWPSRVANMASNSLLRGVRLVEDAIAGGLDATASKLFGKEREIYVSEGAVSLLAHRRAFAEAVPKWWQEMKRHMMLQPDDLSRALEKGSMMEDLLQGSGAIPGRTGEFIRFHLKGMGADDALAKHFIRTDSMYRQVYRKLRAGDKQFQRLGNESYAQATERIVSDLKANWREALNGAPQYDYNKIRMFEPILKEAEVAARRETFQAELGGTGKSGATFLRNNPIFQLFIPFYRTPINITKETLVRTPLGFLNTARNWKDMTPAQRTGELSRNITGTLLGTGALAYAMAGGASGGGPVDPDEKAMLETTGWQPYSVKIGNQYMSYQRLEPIASVLGVAADAAEAVRNGDFQSAQTGFVRVLQSLGENITNKTFLSGLDALSSAISHPMQYGPSFLKQMQASLIPNSIGFIPVSTLARALDRTYRQTEPFSMSVFYAKLPFLSTTLEPQYGPSGEERQRPGTALEQLISPFSRRTLQEGAARVGAEEVVRLAASPKAPRKYWVAPGGLRVDFAPEERKAMAVAMTEATKFIGDRLVKDPNYIALPDNELDARFRFGRRTKEQVIKDTYSRYRDRVMQQIKPKLVQRAKKKLSERGT